MDSDLNIAKKILIDAVALIGADYFQLPIAGLEAESYRERVYCYELYHQMKSLWPADFPFSLAGEVDKNGHPLIRGGILDFAKPDFIIHVPGNMYRNLLVIEVKASTLKKKAIKIDLRKLSAFRIRADYYAAFYLFYGVAPNQVDALTSLCREIAEESKDVDLGSIQLLIHERPGISPYACPWEKGPAVGVDKAVTSGR